MARGFLTIVAVLAGVGMAMPAAAQFGSIFSDTPPRPPSDVPGQQQRTLPPPDPYMTPQRQLPPGPPPGRTIQRQELPPPPGVARRTEPWISPDLRDPDGAPRPGAPGVAQEPYIPPDAPQLPQQGQQDPQQQDQQQQQQQRQAALPPAGDEVIIKPPEQKIANPHAVFSGLDKVTGRITEFEVAINETVRFGALEVTPRACYTRPPNETQLTDGFIEVDELTLQGELKRIFTGWMFVASPGLNAVEHPIYDVWLKDCKGDEQPAPSVAELPEGEPMPVPPRRPPDLR